MEKFDKKTIQFDGDIPLDELRKLQMKVQNGAEVRKPSASKAPSQPVHINTLPVNKFPAGKGLTATKQLTPAQTNPTKIGNASTFDFFNFGQVPAQKPPQGNLMSQDFWGQKNVPKEPNQQPSKPSDFDFFTLPVANQSQQKGQELPSKGGSVDLLDFGDKKEVQAPNKNSDIFNFF